MQCMPGTAFSRDSNFTSREFRIRSVVFYVFFFAGVYVVSFDENFVRCCVCWVVRFGVQGLEDGQGLF